MVFFGKLLNIIYIKWVVGRASERIDTFEEAKQ